MWAGHADRLITGHSTRQSRIQVRLGEHLGSVELAKLAGNVQGKIDMLIITGLIKAGFSTLVVIRAGGHYQLAYSCTATVRTSAYNGQGLYEQEPVAATK